MYDIRMGRTKTSCSSRSISLTKFHREGENVVRRMYNILAFVSGKWNEQMILTGDFSRTFEDKFSIIMTFGKRV